MLQSTEIILWCISAFPAKLSNVDKEEWGAEMSVQSRKTVDILWKESKPENRIFTST